VNDERAHQLLMERTTFKQQRACNTKRRFPSKKNATATARAIGGTMHAYRCPLCRSWHLGHDRFGVAAT